MDFVDDFPYYRISHGEDLNRVFDEVQAQGVSALFIAFIEGLWRLSDKCTDT
jgi:hypothetical protein